MSPLLCQLSYTATTGWRKEFGMIPEDRPACLQNEEVREAMIQVWGTSDEVFGGRPEICFCRSILVKYVRCRPNSSAALV